MLPKRPKSEEMIGQNDDETDEYAVGRGILSSCGTTQSYCNDGLRQVQEEILDRDPEDQPKHENEGVGENDGEKGRGAAGTLEDVGERREGREGRERGSGLGGDESEGCKEELHDGENGGG